jgi:hypothetical protein
MRLDDGDGEGGEKLFSARRVRNLLLGMAGAVALGLLLVNTFTYVQYGGTMFDKYFEKEKKKSPAAGKFAYTKETGYYVGIIRDEGTSPRRGKVFYIEQAGGTMIEVAKDLIEVREPDRQKQ